MIVIVLIRSMKPAIFAIYSPPQKELGFCFEENSNYLKSKKITRTEARTWGFLI